MDADVLLEKKLEHLYGFRRPQNEEPAAPAFPPLSLAARVAERLLPEVTLPEIALTSNRDLTRLIEQRFTPGISSIQPRAQER